MVRLTCRVLKTIYVWHDKIYEGFTTKYLLYCLAMSQTMKIDAGPTIFLVHLEKGEYTETLWFPSRAYIN